MPKQHRPKHPHHRWITNSEAVVSVREAGRLMGLCSAPQFRGQTGVGIQAA